MSGFEESATTALEQTAAVQTATIYVEYEWQTLYGMTEANLMSSVSKTVLYRILPYCTRTHTGFMTILHVS